jgi:hypothetical protein
MKIRLIYSIIFLAILILSCQTESSNKENKTSTSNAVILKTTLGTLDVNNPRNDLDENIKNNDLRFVGVYGYACYAPGIENHDISLTEKYGIKCLEGTSDSIDGDEHANLIDTAKTYAEIYNGMLLMQLKNKENP